MLHVRRYNIVVCGGRNSPCIIIHKTGRCTIFDRIFRIQLPTGKLYGNIGYGNSPMTKFAAVLYFDEMNRVILREYAGERYAKEVRCHSDPYSFPATDFRPETLAHVRRLSDMTDIPQYIRDFCDAMRQTAV